MQNSTGLSPDSIRYFLSTVYLTLYQLALLLSLISSSHKFLAHSNGQSKKNSINFLFMYLTKTLKSVPTLWINSNCRLGFLRHFYMTFGEYVVL